MNSYARIIFKALRQMAIEYACLAIALCTLGGTIWIVVNYPAISSVLFLIGWFLVELVSHIKRLHFEQCGQHEQSK